MFHKVNAHCSFYVLLRALKVLLFHLFIKNIYALQYMSRFYPEQLTYSILWTITTGAIWGEVSCPGTHRHADCSGV